MYTSFKFYKPIPGTVNVDFKFVIVQDLEPNVKVKQVMISNGIRNVKYVMVTTSLVGPDDFCREETVWSQPYRLDKINICQNVDGAQPYTRSQFCL